MAKVAVLKNKVLLHCCYISDLVEVYQLVVPVSCQSGFRIESYQIFQSLLQILFACWLQLIQQVWSSFQSLSQFFYFSFMHLSSAVLDYGNCSMMSVVLIFEYLFLSRKHGQSVILDELLHLLNIMCILCLPLFSILLMCSSKCSH